MSPGVTNLFSMLDASDMHEAHAFLLQGYNQGYLKDSDLMAAVADGLVDISTGIRKPLIEL